ncbi:hypothetical protein NKH77_50940 [Streptomyces sp. M19]
MTQTDGRERRVHALLSDGATVEIRPAAPDDRDRVRRMHERMSRTNPRLRFLGAGTRSAEPTARRVCVPPGPATVPCWPSSRTGWWGRRVPQRARSAVGRDEVFEQQRADPRSWKSSATATAREDGITSFTADSLADNHAVRRVFTDLGLRLTRHFENGEVRRRPRAS